MNPIFRPVSGGSPRLEDDFHTYSLIVPCVGVGNVAQLACDLLVHNLGCSLVAHCDFRYLPAVVGANPYVDQSASEQSDMLTSAQLYANHSTQLLVLQIRVPPFRDGRARHVQELTSFLHAIKPNRVILLSSSYAIQCTDTDLCGSNIRYAVTDALAEADRAAVMQQALPPLSHLFSRPEAASSRDHCYRLHGSGVSGRVFAGIRDLPVCWLNIFASEGDNTADAVVLVQHVCAVLLCLKVLRTDLDATWTPPPSWSRLFGNPVTESLY